MPLTSMPSLTALSICTTAPTFLIYKVFKPNFALIILRCAYTGVCTTLCCASPECVLYIMGYQFVKLLCAGRSGLRHAVACTVAQTWLSSSDKTVCVPALLAEAKIPSSHLRKVCFEEFTPFLASMVWNACLRDIQGHFQAAQLLETLQGIDSQT